jgi:hypothetical protein
LDFPGNSSGGKGSGQGSDTIGSQYGLYSHVAGYFILGAKQGGNSTATGATTTAAGTAAPPSTKATATSNSTSAAANKKKLGEEEAVKDLPPQAEPVLMKLVMFRADVIRVEKELRNVRDELTDAVAKNDGEKMRNCAFQFGDTLCRIVVLLGRGYLEEEKGVKGEEGEEEGEEGGALDRLDLPLSVVTGGGLGSGTSGSVGSPGSGSGTDGSSSSSSSSSGVPLSVTVRMTREPGAPECHIPITDMVLARLSEIFSCNRDTDNAVESSVCAFLRTALGYVDN